MSRILRRPMFRGGHVSSYGTGIASGLADGGRVNYEGGGQIGGGIIYGQPMADGRYGFALPKKQNLFNVEDVIGETQTGAALGHLKAPDFQPIQTVNEVAQDEAGKIDEVDTVGEEKVVNTTDEYITVERPDRMGGTNTVRIKNPNYKVPTKTVEVGRNKTKIQVPLSDAEIAVVEKEGKWGPGVDGEQHIPTNALLQDDNDEVVPELSAKEMVEANKELFGELLGLDKARGQDISDMLIGASAKFLKPGATVKGGLGEFMEAESQRPSRRQKLQDTAAGLAIQDYIAGKRSKEQIAALTGKIDYEYKKKLEMSMPQKDDTAQVALYKIASLTDSKSGSDSTIKEFIKFKTGAPTVRNDKIKMKDLDNPKKQKKLTIGYNIIEEDGVKNIVKWDGTNYDIVSLSEIWAQE